MVLLSVALLALLPAATQASAGASAHERYCGLGGKSRDVYVVGDSVTCVAARAAIRKMTALPPRGNSPGSPPGWNCYRLSGGLSGAACDRHGATVESFGAADGTLGDGKAQHGHCAGAGSVTEYLITNYQEIVYVTNGFNCSYLEQALVDWHWNTGGSPPGPVAFLCEPTSGAATVCHRGKRSFRFGAVGAGAP